MASKIFTGDMPELMENILDNLNDEFETLYSCALVNRHWCKMSIPILWQDPFLFKRRSSLISVYISSLNEDEKFGLKKFGINKEFSETLFDYARFLKVLNIFSLKFRVRIWVDSQDIQSRDSLKEHVNNLLLKLFFKSATLHKLYIEFSEIIKPEIFCILEQNEQFFSRLQNLSLGTLTYDNYEYAIKLFGILEKNTRKITALNIDIFDFNHVSRLLCIFGCFIKSQEQLRQFGFVGDDFDYCTEFYGSILALESQKNSLQEIILEYCDYSAEFEILKNFKKLEILRIRHCGTKLLKKLNYKIITLEISGCMINGSTIASILEKSGILLQRLTFNPIDEILDESIFLEALKSFCPNLTYLNISNIDFFTQLLELVGNLQKLQFLTLLFNIIYTPDEVLKIRIKQFAEILPLTLQYLNLRGDWLNPFIDTFLNHCNAPLKKLIIYHLDNEKHSKALIEFCKRKRTLNYVGLEEYSNLDDNIKKEVGEYVMLVQDEQIIVNC